MENISIGRKWAICTTQFLYKTKHSRSSYEQYTGNLRHQNINVYKNVKRGLLNFKKQKCSHKTSPDKSLIGKKDSKRPPRSTKEVKSCTFFTIMKSRAQISGYQQSHQQCNGLKKSSTSFQRQEIQRCNTNSLTHFEVKLA